MKKDLKEILSNIDLVIFDMDGLLVDSEPLWKIAEKKVFGDLGLHLSDVLLRQVMGFRLSEVVEHWYNYQPWQNPDFKQVEDDIIRCMQNLITENATALQGVNKVLDMYKQQEKKIALASSSAMLLINTVVQKLNISSYFDLLWSAQFEEYGKPHPAIFISAAQQLKIPIDRCLVFEDSINGVIAAKAAKMKCIAIPEKATCSDLRFEIADAKFASLTNFYEEAIGL